MNQTYYHGQPLTWNPARLAFIGTHADPAWLTRDYRSL